MWGNMLSSSLTVQFLNHLIYSQGESSLSSLTAKPIQLKPIQPDPVRTIKPIRAESDWFGSVLSTNWFGPGSKKLEPMIIGSVLR